MKSLFSLFIPIYFLVAFRLWTPVSHTTDVVNTNPTIQATETAMMMVSVTAGSNSPQCSGATLDVHATPTGGTAPYTYQWTGPNGFSSTSETPSIANVTTAASGVYSVTVTDATTATATASVTVTINPAASVNAGPNQVLCRNTNAQLAGVIGGGATSATWSASIPGGVFLPNANTLNAVYDPPTNYSGTVTLALTTNDPAGPCSSASDQMLIHYGNPDALVCNDQITLAMDEDCNVQLTADMLLEGDVPEELYQVNVFTAQGINIGTNVTSQYVGSTLVGRVKDICTGNVCYTNINVVDNLPPVITCQNITLPCAVSNYTPEYIRDVLGFATAFPTVVENCSPYTLTRFDTWVDVGCNEVVNGISGLSGYMKRIWTAKDASNNSTTCTQYIYFQRIPIASITLPTDATVDCSSMNTNPLVTGVPYYSAFGIQFPLFPGSSFCEVSATKQDQVVSYCAGQQSIIRTWTLFDLCGGSSTVAPLNPITYIQVINTIDPVGPQFDCPEDMTVSTNSLNCCAIVNLPDVIMEDACSYVRDAKAIIVTKNPFTGDTLSIQAVDATLTNFPGNNPIHKDTLANFPNSPCLPIGTHFVTYEAEDACGAVSRCTFEILVEDATPPLAVCDEFTKVALGIDGMALVFAETFDDGSYDNCSPVFFKARRQDANGCQPNNKFYDAVKFCCEDIGDTVTVIMRVYDVPPIPGEVTLDYEEQHSNDCIVQVYVEDKLKPVCIPPANVTVSCENFDPSFWAHGQPQAVDNCCLDTIISSANYAAFDTVCNKGTITRTFKAYDCTGNSNTCTQKIVVEYKQQYFVKFPNDVVITTCDGTGNYGAPTFFGEDCELLATSYEDAVFTVVPDACFKIERTWTIINWCTYDPNAGCTYVPNPNPSTTPDHINNLTGPTVSAFGTVGAWAPTVVKISPTDATTTNFSYYFNQNTNCYKYKQIIKIVDLQKPVVACPTAPVEICDYTQNDTMLWNQKYLINDHSGHDLCETPADVCVTGTDACSGTNISFHYILFLDLDNDGVMETAINSINPPTNGTVNFGNATLPGYTGGTSVIFDKRPVTANQKYGWALQTSNTGNNVTACIKWNTIGAPGTFTAPQLPVGRHKVKWFISDGCGNESTCEYKFEVKDCKKPTVVCQNGFSANNILIDGITVYAATFLEETYDNCTPSNLLKIAIRKSGTGSGFPTNPDGSPQTSVHFTCAELGTQLVEIWSMDLAGNADYCETYIIIQDNTGTCGQNLTVAGALNTENGHGVEDTYMELAGSANNGLPNLNMFSFSDQNGGFHFNNALPVSSSYTLMPQKDHDPLNGVNTYDLVLISRHILGLEPLNSPYKLIAADANKSGTVTTFDIVELRKLILGSYQELPTNASWRFVDENFTFANVDNPFEQTFPESKSYSTAMSNMMEENFVAVKVGDVDNSNIPNNLMNVDDRADKTVYFEVEDRTVAPGDVVTATFKCSEDILAYQMTVQLGNVDLLSIEPGLLQTEEHFAMFPERKAITSSWDGQGRPEFKVRFRANETGKLSDMIAVSSEITRAEGYNMAEEKTNIGLRFLGVNGNDVIANVGFELYQNQPNPFLTKTVIGFHLPEAADVKLTIFDETGRTLMTKNGNYPKGYNRILFDSEKIEATASLLYYRIETANFNSTRKMIKTK